MKEWLSNNWVEKTFALISIIFAALDKRLSKKIHIKFKEQDAIKLGIQALLRNDIIHSYNKALDKGFCPLYDLENITAMYTQYKALGGNGVIEEIMDKLKDLPIESEERRKIKCSNKLHI